MTRMWWDFRPYLRGLVIDALGISKPPKNPPLPDKGPSIVVLPFETASADDEYLTDGVTQALTNNIARSSNAVFVISADSAFSLKGTKPDPTQIGKELGVRYILRGSVARSGDELSIDAELIEAAPGTTLWSASFECGLTDMHAVQVEIVERILGAVGFELESAELDRLTRPPTKIRSVEAVWRGYYHMRQLHHKDLLAARALFQGAIDEDPELASAYGLLAGTYTQEHTQGWSLDDSLLDRAWELASKGVELDPDSGVGHGILGVVQLVRGNWREAVKHEDRSIAADPCITWPHAMRGVALTMGHQRLEASRSIRRALRLDPFPPHGLLMALAYINMGAGRRAEAIELLEKVRRENDDNILVRIGLAAHHQREGDKKYAQELAQQILRINPDITAEIAKELIPSLDRIHSQAEVARRTDDLAAAGLPRNADKAGNAR
ncbi:tetratricopeptide repeat protein [Nonomuraea sp. NPDC050556]|uniref:tetratricopeptide repeat protein n=1 Tax=Nonomuraea sp. NPDC050556 TaxID=3364369 RepID=UPI0037BD786C